MLGRCAIDCKWFNLCSILLLCCASQSTHKRAVASAWESIASSGCWFQPSWPHLYYSVGICIDECLGCQLDGQWKHHAAGPLVFGWALVASCSGWATIKKTVANYQNKLKVKASPIPKPTTSSSLEDLEIKNFKSLVMPLQIEAWLWCYLMTAMRKEKTRIPYLIRYPSTATTTGSNSSSNS